MELSIEAITLTGDIPTCMPIQNIWETTQNDMHLQELKDHINKDWSSNENEVIQVIRIYWMFRDELKMIDGVAMKSNQVIIAEELQQQALEQLYTKYMGNKTTGRRIHVCDKQE